MELRPRPDPSTRSSALLSVASPIMSTSVTFPTTVSGTSTSTVLSSTTSIGLTLPSTSTVTTVTSSLVGGSISSSIQPPRLSTTGGGSLGNINPSRPGLTSVAPRWSINDADDFMTPRNRYLEPTNGYHSAPENPVPIVRPRQTYSDNPVSYRDRGNFNTRFIPNYASDALSQSGNGVNSDVESMQREITDLRKALAEAQHSGNGTRNNGNIGYQSRMDNGDTNVNNNHGTRYLNGYAPRVNTQIGSRTNTDAPKLRMPLYNGRTEWEPFWEQFETMAKRFNWTPNEQCEQLLFCFKDEALSFASKLASETKKDIYLFVAAMKRRFGDFALPETYRAQLLTSKKKFKETIQEYAYRVTVLMRKAYPGLEGTELFNGLTIEHLLNGLPDQHIAYDVLTKKPKSLEEAMDMIAWHECCKGNSRGRTFVRQTMVDSDLAEYEVAQEDTEIRRVSGKRYATEERLQQFGRELKDSIIKEVTHSVTESVTNGVKELISQQMTKQQAKPNQTQSEAKSSFRPNANMNEERRRTNYNPIVCFHCQAPGHMSRSCPKRGMTQNNRSHTNVDPSSRARDNSRNNERLN